MADWRIEFATTIGDVTVARFSCEISQLSRYISKTGSLTASIPLPNMAIGAAANEVIGGEGRLSCYVYYGEQIWWGGFLDSTRITGSANGAVLEVGGSSFESYVDRREARINVQATNWEQTEYARYLWDYMQSTGPGSDIGVETDFPAVTSKTLSMSWLRSEARTVGSVLKEVSNRESGFEWIVDVFAEGDDRRRRLTIGYPIIGRPESGLVMSYPGAILTYEIDGDAMDGATSFQARGKAPDPVGTPGRSSRGYYNPITKTTTVVQSPAGASAESQEPIMSDEFPADAYLRNGYVRRDVTVERDTVTQKDTLNKWAMLARATRSGPLVLPGVVARLDGMSQGILGSNVLLRINDTPFPQKPDGAPGYEGTSRVIGYEIDPGEFGSMDVVKLIFEDPTSDDALDRSPL